MLLVWKRGFSVYHRPLEAPEAAAMRRLAAGATLAELGEASALEEEPLEASARTARALASGASRHPTTREMAFNA